MLAPHANGKVCIVIKPILNSHLCWPIVCTKTIRHMCSPSWDTVNYVAGNIWCLLLAVFALCLCSNLPPNSFSSYATQVQAWIVALQFVLQILALQWSCWRTAQHLVYTAEDLCMQVLVLCQPVLWWPCGCSCNDRKAYNVAQDYQWNSYRKRQGIVGRYDVVREVKVGQRFCWGFCTSMVLGGWNCRCLCHANNASTCRLGICPRSSWQNHHLSIASQGFHQIMLDTPSICGVPRNFCAAW